MEEFVTVGNEHNVPNQQHSDESHFNSAFRSTNWTQFLAYVTEFALQTGFELRQSITYFDALRMTRVSVPRVGDALPHYGRFECSGRTKEPKCHFKLRWGFDKKLNEYHFTECELKHECSPDPRRTLDESVTLVDKQEKLSSAELECASCQYVVAHGYFRIQIFRAMPKF